MTGSVCWADVVGRMVAFVRMPTVRMRVAVLKTSKTMRMAMVRLVLVLLADFIIIFIVPLVAIVPMRMAVAMSVNRRTERQHR